VVQVRHPMPDHGEVNSRIQYCEYRILGAPKGDNPHAGRNARQTHSSEAGPRLTGVDGQSGSGGVVAEAVARVVVDEADGLHEGVANRRADEAEAAALQVFADRVGFGRRGRQVSRGRP
jgi:hypothetical protein